MTNRVIIVGGGITGLTAAYRLNQANFRATIIEKSPTLGGVIRTERMGDCLLECGPDSFLSSKAPALDLIRELGLAGEVIGSNDHKRVIYILKNGRLIPLPGGMRMMIPTRVMPLLASRLIGWPAKLRMAGDLFRRPGGPRPDRSVQDFLASHYGQEAVDYLAEPLLAGVFGGDPALLSANSVLPRFVQLEEQFGSLSRGVLASQNQQRTGSSDPLFRTLKSGLGTLIANLAPAADVIHGQAEALEHTAYGMRLRVSGQWLETDRVLIAAPAYVAGDLLAPLDAELSDLLNAIPYNSSLTVSLVFDQATFGRPFPGVGFLIPKRERVAMKACTCASNKFEGRAGPDKVLLRCFFGGDHATEPDAGIVAQALQELRAMIGLRAEPVASYVARWPRAMAQYTVGHAKRVEAIETRIAGLPHVSIAGNGYHGIGIPDCIQSANQVAALIVAGLTRNPRHTLSAPRHG